MRNINSGKLTKNAVLSKISQISIFSYYMNIPEALIKHCIDTGELICSPLRNDEHPTAGFRYDNKGKLKFRDFSGVFWGDCFDVVALVISKLYKQDIDVSNKQDFIKVLRHITLVFKDIFYGKEKDINLLNEINATIVDIKNKKPNIEIVVREWNESDKLYWEKFGVSLQYLNINFVYPVEQYYINRKINPEPKYFYKDSDPCYAYLLGKDKSGINNIKLYFPNREKGATRFITNCNHLEGIYNLNDEYYDFVIITKSSKDRLSIGNAIKNINSLYGGKIEDKIGVINVPHETYRLKQNEYDWLRNKVPEYYNIVSFMDNDRTGKLEAKWLQDNYSITPILIPKSYKAKDFSELYSTYNLRDIAIIIINTIKKVKEYGRQIVQRSWDEFEDNTMPY